MRLGFVYTRIREDEKLLLNALRDRGHDVVKVDASDVGFGLSEPRPPDAFSGVDLAYNRCLESSRVRYVAAFLHQYDVPVVNRPETSWVCADKIRGSLALERAGVPTPKTEVAFTVDGALTACDRFGYPCVLKPITGSWGRLVARLDTRAAAEAVLEHKETLGGYEHKVFYIQEYVEKPGRDIRVLAADGVPIAAMTRSSDHWITNAARGGRVEAFEIVPEVRRLVEDASEAVGGGLLGVDLMETRDGYTVHEVNSTCEFKALNEAVPSVDVPDRIVDWLERQS